MKKILINSSIGITLLIGGNTNVKSATLVSSYFGIDAENWSLMDWPNSYIAPIAWIGTTGNPAGSIYADDPDGGDFYFGAPEKFLGNKSAAYGGMFTYDLLVTESDNPPWYTPFISITGGDMTLNWSSTVWPIVNEWKTYQVRLDETGGWIRSSDDNTPTAAEFKAVLSSLSALIIRGEFHNGSDRSFLDNVTITSVNIPTTTTLASSLNPAALGQNVTFTAKVAAAPTPSGSLTFKVDGVAKSTGPLSTGQLTYATAALTTGAHTIRAEYAGTTTFAPSVAQLTQTVVGKPDFVVTAVNLTPLQPTVGNTFTAAVTVKNQGGTGNGGQLRLWANNQVTTAQVCAATGGDKNVAVGSVAAGASKTLTVTGLNPGVKGAKILRAFVDAACTVAEANDNNNQFVKGYMVKDLRADFVVTALTVTPASPTANSLFTVSATVKNQGLAARAAGYLDVWVNKPTAPSCGAADSDAWIDIGTLAAGASKAVTLSLVADTAGTKTARAYVDSWCETIEANETNNQLIKSYVMQ